MAQKPRTKDEGTWQALAPVDAAANRATPAGTFGAAFDGAAFFGVSTCSNGQSFLEYMSLLDKRSMLAFGWIVHLTNPLLLEASEA